MSSFILRRSLLQSRSTFSRNSALRRTFATHPEQKEAKSSSNNGMILGLLGAGGLGYYFYTLSNDKSERQVLSDKFERANRTLDTKIEGAKEQATQAAYGAKDRLEQAAENTKRSVGVKVDEAGEKYEETKGKASELKNEAQKEGEKKLDYAKEKGQELQEKAGEKIKEVGDKVKASS
ncbi:hypothetical protein BY458DRAFT_446753 [Sporodiniella umbellata]|nr:hypothetical protein BY458DRAFT_446753 [Sporodiniella umbellata]